MRASLRPLVRAHRALCCLPALAIVVGGLVRLARSQLGTHTPGPFGTTHTTGPLDELIPAFELLLFAIVFTTLPCLVLCGAMLWARAPGAARWGSSWIASLVTLILLLHWILVGFD